MRHGKVVVGQQNVRQVPLLASYARPPLPPLSAVIHRLLMISLHAQSLISILIVRRPVGGVASCPLQ